MRPYYGEGSKTVAYEIAGSSAGARRTLASCRSLPASLFTKIAKASPSGRSWASSTATPRR